MVNISKLTEQLIEKRLFNSNDDYLFFDDLFAMYNMGKFDIHSLPVLFNGLHDNREDAGYHDSFCNMLIGIFDKYPMREVLEVFIDSYHIFYPHATDCYMELITYWTFGENNRKLFVEGIKSLNDSIKYDFIIKILREMSDSNNFENCYVDETLKLLNVNSM